MLLALTALLVVGTADPKPEASVAAIRREYQKIEDDVAAGRLRKATITIGGGQNPAELEADYQAGSDDGYIHDPYATPFHLRRVVLNHTLPAVGEASVSFWFARDGKLLFAFARGPDLSGVTGYESRAGDELRVYYEDGVAFRVVLTSHTTDGAAVAVDVAAAEKAAREKAVQAGAALAKKGRSLADAFAALAKD